MNTSSTNTNSGFVLNHSTPVDELNLTLHVYHHQPTGARYLHIDCDDDNNLFGIGFKTTPHDSTGVAHILEHTVLCGSRNYPVRDPFFSMLKRSLNTFMNALTASDWTLYPFATRNRRDFYNLMGVYLDAVFFPLLREEDFWQEGHRLEFSEATNPQSPLEIKGIVFNEMKGAMADPSSLLARRLNRALFPTLTYGHNSGGEPTDIPSLDYQALRDFHARYYHPSNSFLCSYGNLPVEQHFAFIEEHALKHFSCSDPDTAIPREKRYTSPQHVQAAYPIDPGTPSGQRTLVQIGWLAAPIEDQREIAALNVLASLLIGNPSAPLYKDLLDCGLGLNLAPGTGYHDDTRETFFAAGLQGSNPEKTAEVESVILNTLSTCAEHGFRQEQIDAALHQLEFSFREVGGDSYPYGLTLLMRLFASWLHNDDPVTPMQALSTYDTLRRTAHADRTFQKLIRRHFLDNPHRVTLTLAPDSELKTRQEQAQREMLDKLRKGMSESDIRSMISRSRALQLSQESPGEIETLPTLNLEDIPSQEQAVDGVSAPLGEVPCWLYDQPTNGIVYLNLRFDLAPLDEDLAPFLPLYCILLPQVGAAGQDYLEVSQRIAAYTGGIRAAAQVIDHADKLDGFTSCLEVRGKALYRHSGELMKLLGELLSSADFEDHQRLHKVINQLCISLENGIPAAGHSYAMRIAAAHLSPASRLKETWNGIEQLRLVREWAGRKPDELGPLSQRLKQIALSLVNSQNLRMQVTAEHHAHAGLRDDLSTFLGEYIPPLDTFVMKRSAWTPLAAHSGWIVASPVAYVARAFRTAPYTHPDAPVLAVLARLLRAGYLHREIRERGGAYGGMVINDSLSGLMSMVSYRDPHISRTLQVFHDAAVWVAAGSFSDTDIKEAVLSCFSELDRPNSPAGRAYREFSCLEQGLSRTVRQQFREGILGVKRQQLISVSERYLLDGWERSAVAVLAGDTLMREEQDKLAPALSVERL